MGKIKKWSKRSDTSWRHDEQKQGIVVKKNKPRYNVDLVRNGEKTKTISKANTKKKAKKKAVKWMRKNPEGEPGRYT